MQENSSQNYTFSRRLESLKFSGNFTDEQLASLIGVSRRMLYLMRVGKSSVSRKMWHLLEKAERAAGLAPPEPITPPAADAPAEQPQSLVDLAFDPLRKAMPSGALAHAMDGLKEALSSGVLADLVKANRKEIDELRRKLDAVHGDVAEIKRMMEEAEKKRK